MQRRELLRAVAGLATLPFVPRTAEALAAFGTRVHQDATRALVDFRTLTPAQQVLVSQLCDHILPATDTPGALDVRVPEFIDLLLTEWYADDDRVTFLAGLDAIDARARSAGARSFAESGEEGMLAVMRALDTEREAKDGAGATFGHLKSLTVFAYFTSERITKEVLKTRLYFRTYDGNAAVPS